MVLLINGIDKADIKFPNDLRQELDKIEFHVYGTGETTRVRYRPIVIINSNNEKRAARCVFVPVLFTIILFLNAATMHKIVGAYDPGIKDNLPISVLT